jgi:hypothetical protein
MNNDGFDGDPINVCKQYKDGNLTGFDKNHVESLTGWSKPSDVFDRENGVRLMTSVIAEIAMQQNWNVFGILEGAPFQNERALFTNDFAHSMPDTDYILYIRLGMTYKF